MREGYGITDHTVVVPTFVDDFSSKIARKFGRISHISAGRMYYYFYANITYSSTEKNFKEMNAVNRQKGFK